MTKILSEEKVQKLLKDKMISIESYRESSLADPKKDEPTLEDKRLEAISRQTAAIEKLSMLLHQNLIAILEKTSIDVDLQVKNLRTILKEHSERLGEILSNDGKSARASVKWRFKVHRDDRGRIETIEAKPEN